MINSRLSSVEDLETENDTDDINDPEIKEVAEMLNSNLSSKVANHLKAASNFVNEFTWVLGYPLVKYNLTNILIGKVFTIIASAFLFLM